MARNASFLTGLSPKPVNSAIEVQNLIDRTIISWENPRGGFRRFANLLFLTAWMGGWVMGEMTALSGIIRGEALGFLIIWIIVWTAGGVFCVAAIFQLARPSRPERIILDSLCISYEPGTEPFNTFGTKRRSRSLFEIIKSRKGHRAAKKEIVGIRIDRVGERQRLSLDCGSKRIEVGRFLEGPEREWLLAVLTAWRSDNTGIHCGVICAEARNQDWS